MDAGAVWGILMFALVAVIYVSWRHNEDEREREETLRRVAWRAAESSLHPGDDELLNEEDGFSDADPDPDWEESVGEDASAGVEIFLAIAEDDASAAVREKDDMVAEAVFQVRRMAHRLVEDPALNPFVEIVGRPRVEAEISCLLAWWCAEYLTTSSVDHRGVLANALKYSNAYTLKGVLEEKVVEDRYKWLDGSHDVVSSGEQTLHDVVTLIPQVAIDPTMQSRRVVDLLKKALTEIEDEMRYIWT